MAEASTLAWDRPRSVDESATDRAAATTAIPVNDRRPMGDKGRHGAHPGRGKFTGLEIAPSDSSSGSKAAGEREHEGLSALVRS